MSSDFELPVIDIDIFMSQPRDSVSVQEECRKVVNLVAPGFLLA